MRNFAYIRVSTSDQNASLEAQQEKILNYCKFKGWAEPEFLIDEHISGGKPILERPAGSKLSGIKDANILSVKLDRLFRNTVDAMTMRELWHKNKVGIILIDEGGNTINASTAIGIMLYGFRALTAEYEKNIISERTSTVLQHKKKNGKQYTGAIFGFDKKDGELVENIEEMTWINRIFGLREGGLSLQGIADKLNEAKVKPKNNGKFYPSTIKYILENNIYKT